MVYFIIFICFSKKLKKIIFIKILAAKIFYNYEYYFIQNGSEEVCNIKYRLNYFGVCKMIFTVANQKGGVGKTTFLINFAYYLKDYKEKSVLVIDTDTQANCSYSLNNANIIGDTYNIFTENVNYLYHKDLDIKKDEINLLRSTIDLSNENEFNSPNYYIQNLEYLYNLFDYILIDTAPVLSNKLIYSLQYSDFVITPIELEIYSLQGLSLMLNTIFNIKKSVNQKMSFLGVLPSRVITTNKRQINNLEKLYNEYGKDLFLPYIKYRNDLANATANQVSFFKTTSKHKKELINVFDEIYEKMQGEK